MDISFICKDDSPLAEGGAESSHSHSKTGPTATGSVPHVSVSVPEIILQLPMTACPAFASGLINGSLPTSNLFMLVGKFTSPENYNRYAPNKNPLKL